MLLRRSELLRWLLQQGVRAFAPRQRVGAVALLEHEGRILVARHVFRPDHPWGLPGGWIHSREWPEQALRRELREELGVEASVGALVMAARHAPRLDPAALTLIYRANLSPTALPALRLSFELLEARWLQPEDAIPLLRPFEVSALRLAYPELAG